MIVVDILPTTVEDLYGGHANSELLVIADTIC